VARALDYEPMKEQEVEDIQALRSKLYRPSQCVSYIYAFWLQQLMNVCQSYRRVTAWVIVTCWIVDYSVRIRLWSFASPTSGAPYFTPSVR
jgi:hypothetical protein